MDEDRKLTDGDIRALASELKKQFYSNLGEGVWSMAWKAIVLAIVAVVAYGSLKGFK